MFRSLPTTFTSPSTTAVMGNLKNMSNMTFSMVSKKDQANQKTDSLFSMALYDLGSVPPSQGVVSVPKLPTQFGPSDEYKDLSLREILDLSEDCLFNEDDSFPKLLPSQNPLPVPCVSSTVPLVPTPSLSQDDLEWAQLDEIPIMTTSLDDIPVAAALVSTIDNTTCSGKKRGFDDDFLEDSEDDDANLDSNEKRFRPYQTGQWSEKFEELCEYRKKHGHCLVPHTFSENLPLARWVKRQRYQYKLLMEGKTSTMTEDRVKALEDIGFVWDSQGAAWGERLAELKEYRDVFFHCNVPSNYSENPQLATWVKCQRRQYKLFMEGKPSNMTPQRIQELNQLGFEWELRVYKKQRLL